MKIPPRQIDAFVKKPDPAIRAVLIYGPDEGLMRERATIIGKTVVADLNDPFNVAVLSTDILANDPARLNDEANAMSMMGGGRLIRIEGAADSLTPLLKAYLANPSPGSLIVLEGGDLGSRSSLRKLFETSPVAASLPCYAASAGDVQGLIRQELQAVGMSIDPDAVSWLAQQVLGDRALAKGEVEKLILYCGGFNPDRPASIRVSLDDAVASCGQGGDKSMDDLIYATAGGNPETALRTFRQLVDEGTPTIVIHRSLQTHFRRLHYTRSLMEGGLSLGEAMKKLNPPIFFKWEDSFRAQAGRWPVAVLETVLGRLAQLEADCKKTGTPEEILTAQAILSLSAR